MTEPSPAERDGRGRFVPGRSGNPAGKRPGTRNRATRLKELLRDGDEEAAGRAIIARAVAGDAVAGRFLFERLDPKPRGRPIALARAAGTLAERFAAVFAAVAEGDITPDEALALGRLLDLERKAAGAGARDAAAATAPEPTAAQREDTVRAELAAIFGDAARAARPGPTPDPTPESVEPAEPLHSPCIAESRASETDDNADAGAGGRDIAPAAAPAQANALPSGLPPALPPALPSAPPPDAAPGGVTTRRVAYWQGSARVRGKLRRAGLSVTQAAPPASPPSAETRDGRAS